ncbi:MAG: DUF4440 domain-containing protein [Deltaproteobacteria bacterium]|nr:DUF4440 domain-containing protein [Deltaproteobacteria bacterium]
MTVTRPAEMYPRFIEAFNAGDAEALLALFEPSATFAPQPGVTVSGIAAVGAALQQFLALKGTIRLDPVFIMESGDTALIRGKWQVNGTGADGKPVELRGNSIEVIRRQSDGTWRFIIDNPFGAE